MKQSGSRPYIRLTAAIAALALLFFGSIGALYHRDDVVCAYELACQECHKHITAATQTGSDCYSCTVESSLVTAAITFVHPTLPEFKHSFSVPLSEAPAHSTTRLLPPQRGPPA